MIIITDISEKYFELNGIQYAKIYQPLKQGLENIGIYNIYDTKQQLQHSTKFDQYEIDGTVYGSQSLTMAAILDATFNTLSVEDFILLEGRVSSLESDNTINIAKIENLEDNQVTGVETYEELTDLPVSGTLLVSYKVTNDTVSDDNNGFYHWNGSIYVPDFDKAAVVESQFNTLSSDEFNKLNITSEKSLTKTLWREIEIFDYTELSSVRINIASLDQGNFFEFGIYSDAGVKLTSTGRQEMSDAGYKLYPLENVLLNPDTYFLAITTDSLNDFGYNDNVISENSILTDPLPASKPSTVNGSGFIAYELNLNKPNYLPSEIEEYTEGSIYRVFGANGSQPWSWNTSNGKMAFSVSSGASWVDAMNIGSPWSPIDMVTDGSNLYMLMNDFTILKSSDLSGSATWSDITPPSADVEAKGRPYSLCIFNGFLYVGEYSSGTELTGGADLHKMNISTLAWSVSKNFANARHIHAVQSPNASVMYIVLGDFGFGNDVGLWRLTSANQATDTYQQVTENASDPYPVNLAFLDSGEVLGSGDRPPTHIIQKNQFGALGQFILSPKNFKESDSDGTETTRSIEVDTEENAYYITQETSNPSIYVSPPPYIYRFRIQDELTETVARTIISGSYIMNYNRRWKKSTFKFNQ